MKNNKGSGCLAYILGLTFIFGNVLLIGGGLKDLSDNSIAIIMVLVAIVGDCALLVLGISAMAKKHSKKNEESQTQYNNTGVQIHDQIPTTHKTTVDISQTQVQHKEKEAKLFISNNNHNNLKNSNGFTNHRTNETGEEYQKKEREEKKPLDVEATNRLSIKEKKSSDDQEKKVGSQQLVNLLNTIAFNAANNERQAEQERKAKGAKRIEEEHKAAEAKRIEDERKAAEAKLIEERRKVEEEKRKDAVLQRKNAAQKKAETSKIDLSWVKLGAYVYYKQFGFGTITQIKKDTITIRFKSSKRTFSYPDSFERQLIRKAEKQNEAKRPSWRSVVPNWVDIGAKVSHTTFGVGTVKSIADTMICVEFDGDYKYFIIPSAFDNGYLKQITKKEEEMEERTETVSRIQANKSTNMNSVNKPDTEKATKSVEKANKVEPKKPISWNQIDLDEETVSQYQPQPISQILVVGTSTKPPKKKSHSNKVKRPPKDDSVNVNDLHIKIFNIYMQAPDNPPHPHGFYSDQPYEDRRIAHDAYVFVEQAKLLQIQTKNLIVAHSVNSRADYSYTFYSFSNLSSRNLKDYLLWRYRFERESAKIDDRFANLYLQELINNTRGKDNSSSQLQRFIDYVWAVIYENPVECYYPPAVIRQYMIDYYVMNDFSVPVHEFNNMLPTGIRIKPFKKKYPKSKKYSDSLNLLNAESSYDFLQSSFKDSEYGYLLPQAIDYVFEQVEKYLKQYHIDWFKIIFYAMEKDTEPWFPFERGCYYTGSHIEDKTVEFENGDTYLIKDGKGYKQKFIQFSYTNEEPYFCCNPYTFAIGYTIKLIENGLRIALGYRHKLRPDKDSIDRRFEYYHDKSLKKKYEVPLSYFKSEEFESLVKQSTDDFFDGTSIERMILSVSYQKKKAELKIKEEREKEKKKKKEEREQKALKERIAKETGQLVEDVQLQPKVMQFDKSKLEGIRKDSDEVQSLLVVEETEEENDLSTSVELPEPTKRETRLIIKENTDTDNEYVELINALSELEKEVLHQIICEKPVYQISQFVIRNNDTLETVIDRINQMALEILGDNIIDFTDRPYIYEDYLSELSKALEDNNE